MIFQIRLADTGHSQKLELDKMSKGEQLFNHISSGYSIPPRQQLLVTKIGHLIKSQERLERVLTQQRGDKTLLSKDYKQGLNALNERISCIYVFNLKELKQPIEKIQPKTDQYWKNQLKRKVESHSGLRPNISTCSQDLKDAISDPLLKSRPDVAKEIQQISRAFETLEYSWSQLSQINNEIEQVAELCDNQKKCHSSLASLMGSMIEAVSKKASVAVKLVQKWKSQDLIDDRSLRQNSGCFESRKKQEESIITYEQKLRQFKKNTEDKLKIMKIELKELKGRYRQYEKKSLEFANKNFNRQITSHLSQGSLKCNEIVHMLKKIQTNQDFSNIYKVQNQIKLLQKVLQEKAEKQYYLLYQSLAQHFKEFSQMHLQNKNYVKEGFHCFLKWKKIIDQYDEYVMDQERSIQNQISLIPSKVSREPSFLSKNSQNEQSSFSNQSSQKNVEMFKLSLNDAQAKRRLQFYKKINLIQRYLDKLCAQQEQLRKKYFKDNNLSKQKGKELLKNYKVPSIDVDYEGTTDLQLFKSNKPNSSSEIECELTVEQFMIAEYLKIKEKLNGVLSKETNVKVKNLQQIVKGMSEIFLKVYSKKEDQNKRQNQDLNNKIRQAEIASNTHKETLLKIQQKAVQMQRQLKEKNQLIASLQASKSQELARQRSRLQKVMSDKKSLEVNLKSQVKMSEDLCNHINIQDQEMKVLKEKYDQMKQMYGERQICIIKLQKQLAQKDQNGLPGGSQISNLSENELKSIVLQNFGKKDEQTAKLQDEIQRLSQQVKILQSNNQQLEEDNQYLSSQLRKIITKECDDCEAQTQEMPKLKQMEFEGITIGQEISLNQKAIFMPFSHNTYVGVHHKDEEKTICNMSNLCHNNYLLDIQSFSQKTHSLLSQCSFVVVVKVTKIIREDNVFKVRGEIEHLLGFQDDSIVIKDYAPLLKH